MKTHRLAAAFAALSLVASGCLLAQTPPSSSSPDTQPPSSQPAPSSSQAPYNSSSSASQATESSMSKSEAMQNCVAQAKAQNSGASDQAIKEACKTHLGSTPHQ